MIQTANASVTNELETDVAIIGAGPSGLTLASRLSRDLIVIDGGVFDYDLRHDKQFEFEATGLAMNTTSLRRRVFGGAGSRWSGRCAELDAADFVPRSWMAHNGWPISYDTLRPYFDAAWHSLKLPLVASTLAKHDKKASSCFPVPPQLERQLWQFAMAKPNVPVHIGSYFAPTFKSSNRRLLTAADAVRFEADGTKVTAVEVRDRTGGKITVRANHFVLACGCVETSRFLLDNAEEFAELIGPITKWLGRGFHQHLLIDGGRINATRAQAQKLQKTLNRFQSPPAQSHEIGLRLSGEMMAQKQLLSASATFRYGRSQNFQPADLPRLALAYLRETEPVFSNPDIGIELSVEQAIVPTNAISLGTARDMHGRQNAAVHWTIDDLELRSAAALNQTVADWLDAQALGKLERISTAEEISARAMRDSLHHLGGARMSHRADTGVVDTNLSVHSADNLSVIGGSVFPTGGHVNPTLTMMALSLRLADHLDARLSG